MSDRRSPQTCSCGFWDEIRHGSGSIPLQILLRMKGGNESLETRDENCEIFPMIKCVCFLLPFLFLDVKRKPEGTGNSTKNESSFLYERGERKKFPAISIEPVF